MCLSSPPALKSGNPLCDTSNAAMFVLVLGLSFIGEGLEKLISDTGQQG